MTELPDGLERSSAAPNAPKPGRNKGGLIAAALALILVLGGGGAYLALRGDPQPEASKSPSGQSTPTVTQSEPEPSAEPTTSPTQESPAVPAIPGDVVGWANRPYLQEAQQTPYVAGETDHYALLADGTVRSWGSNAYGLLGYGADQDVDAIQTVKGLNGVKQIAVTSKAAFAVLDDGTVQAWGTNEFGLLGDGSDELSSNVPVTVLGLSNVKSLTLAEQAAYALLEDGTVLAWDDNHYGQLGADTLANASFVPIQVVGLSGVVSLASSLHSAFAVLEDGTVKGFGETENGMFGDRENVKEV